MGSGTVNNAFLAGILGGVGNHMMTQEERQYQEKQNELKLKREILASLTTDQTASPQAQALALQGLLASPEQPRAKGIRGALGGKSGQPSPLDDVLNQIKALPAQTQPAQGPIQIPAIPAAPAASASAGASPAQAITGQNPMSEVPPIPVPGMAGSAPLVPPKLGMTGAPPQLPQQTPSIPAIPGLHKSPDELYQQAVIDAGAKTAGQFGAREQYGLKYVNAGILQPTDLPDFVAAQTFGSTEKPTTTFGPTQLVNNKTVREIIINGKQTGKFIDVPTTGAVREWKVDHGADMIPTTIRDPQGGMHQRNDPLVPPDVAADYDNQMKAHQTVRAEHIADAATSAQNALNRQAQADQLRNQDDANKQIRKMTKDFSDADERLRLMRDSERKGNQGDPQADMSMISNHLGMTAGLQKGQRITQAMWNEAVAARPALAGLKVRFVDGILTGVKLTPDQRRQMVGLAEVRREQTLRSIPAQADNLGVDLGKVAPGIVRQLQGGTPGIPAPVDSQIDDLAKRLKLK